VPESKLDTVRRFAEAWGRNDLDGVLECAHPEIEIDWSGSHSTYQGMYRGHEGVTRFWAEQEDVWAEFSIEIVETIDIGDERIVTVNTVRGRGRGSGIALEAGGGMIWSVEDGLIRSARLFQSREEAVEAARGAAGP
jgi:ketosteroid isomerase-like protein